MKAIPETEGSGDEGSLLRQPLAADIGAAIDLAWPNLVGSLFQTIIGWFILKQVGQLGAVEIAAYGLGRTIVMWAGSAYWALSSGLMALVARFVGARQYRRAGQAVIQALYLALTLAMVTAVVGALLAPRLLSWVGGDADVVASGTAFLRVYMFCMVFMVAWFLSTSTLRAAGETRTAMYLQWMVNIIQAVLTYVLVVGVSVFPEMGLLGVAYAMLISRALLFGVLMALIWFRYSRVRLPRLEWPWWRPRWSIMRRVVRISIPSSIEGIARTSAVLTLLTLVSTSADGTVALSGYTIGIQLEPIFHMVGSSLGLAATAMVGQNLGAGYPEEAARGGWNSARFAVAFLGAVGVVILLFAPAVVGFFTSDAGVVSYGAWYMRAMGVASIFIATTLTLGGALRGAGETRTPMLTTIGGFWLVQIPLGFVLSRYTAMGAVGVFWAICIGWVIQAAYVMWRFKQGHWKEVKV